MPVDLIRSSHEDDMEVQFLKCTGHVLWTAAHSNKARASDTATQID